MDPRDAVLQAHTPAVMVPRFGTFEPMTTYGHRFLVADNGLWLEMRRAWLYARLQISATQSGVPIPYGRLEESVELLFGKIPKDLLDDFVGQAKADLPNESAAAIIWNESTSLLSLQKLVTLTAGPAHITSAPASLGAGDHLVADLHSHAMLPAFFSDQDDRDDRSAVKLSVVVGNLDKPVQTFASRLCALGKFITL